MTDAEIIALTRALYPDVTVAAASDAYLTSWLTWARQLTGPTWGDLRDQGVAILLAHRAYRGDPAGVFGGGGAYATGPLASIGKRSLSASWGGGGATMARNQSEADLTTTRAGLAWLALRDTLPGVVVGPVVYG